MSKKYEGLAKEILERVGGDENVELLYHCQTRLRFQLFDYDKADMDALKALDGVSTALLSGGQLQVVIGMHVEEVFEEVTPLLTDKGTSEKASSAAANGNGEQKENILNKMTSFISSAFAPIVPALAGAGMVKAFLSVLVAFNLVDTSGQTYQLISMFSDAAFTFLPMLLAYTVAGRLKCNQIIAAAVAGILLHPTWTGLVSAGEAVYLFGFIPVRLVSYASSVIPIILILLVQAPLEKWLNKVIPNAVKMVFVPMLTFLIMGCLALTILGPIGAYVGSALSYVFLWLGENAPWASPLIVGTLFPIMVMFGIHHGIAPVGTMSLMQLGYDAIWGPGIVCSNIAQGVAALVTAFISKDAKTKELGISAGIPALMGVTEPVLYGVNLPKKYPLIAAMIGGGAGGLFAGITGTRRFAFGSSGIPAVVMYIGDNTMQYFYQIIIALVITAVVTAIATIILSKRYENRIAEAAEEIENKTTAIVNAETMETETIADHAVYAPVKGTKIALSDFPDAVFSEGILGQGCGINPEEDIVYAPFHGKVENLQPSRHALGLVSQDGIELLIHVGVDTVAMNGDGFTPFVKEGDMIQKGQKLLRFDRKKIKDAGYTDAVAVIITNSDEYQNITAKADGQVSEKDIVLTVEK